MKNSKYFLVGLLLNFSLLLSAQAPEIRIIKAEDIPISTSVATSEIVNAVNIDSIQDKNLVLIDQDSLQQIDIVHLNTNTAGQIQLHDDPELAEIDQKWMELVKHADLYDTASYIVQDIPENYTLDAELSTEVLKQRLAELDARTPFHVTYNANLEKLINHYLKTRGKALANLMAKSKYYFPLFEEKLAKYDIPLEIKYLAIVESALRPKARSRVGATGLWQFMYQTGKQYDLDVSSYVDERQDPFLATEAACQYLSDLYDIFSDWDLALAAYNSGPGNVTKAIRRSGGNTNYWNIRPFLPRETAGYLPIFYATYYLFEYAEEHGLYADANFDLQHYEVDSIQVKQLISFDQIQTVTGIEAELLEFLNPAYKLNIIPHIKDKNYSLVLPKKYVGLFAQNEDAIYAYAAAEDAKREKPRPEYTEMDQRVRYRVRSGDYLGRIAERYGVGVRQIMRWNNMRSTRLRVGQRLTIYPRRLPEGTTKKTAQTKTTQPKPRGTYETYVVKSGDSLWSIAQKYQSVSVAQLKSWNNLTSNKLKVGTKLKLYKG